MNTLLEFINYISSEFGNLEAYNWIEEDSIVSKTFNEFKNDTKLITAEIYNSFESQRKMAIIGDTSYDWICTYYGIMNSSNISVPLDTKLTPDELIERIKFADVSIVFISKNYSSIIDDIKANC